MARQDYEGKYVEFWLRISESKRLIKICKIDMSFKEGEMHALATDNSLTWAQPVPDVPPADVEAEHHGYAETHGLKPALLVLIWDLGGETWIPLLKQFND